jgi:hypothetical protein
MHPMQRKPQQQTLSLRISAELRSYLECWRLAIQGRTAEVQHQQPAWERALREHAARSAMPTRGEVFGMVEFYDGLVER